MRIAKLIITSLFLSTAAYAHTGLYSAVAPTVSEAQLIVDSINNGRIRISDCGIGGGKVYDVEFPDSPTSTRVNRFGQIEVVASKTLFKVNCNSSNGDR